MGFGKLSADVSNMYQTVECSNMGNISLKIPINPNFNSPQLEHVCRDRHGFFACRWNSPSTDVNDENEPHGELDIFRLLFDNVFSYICKSFEGTDPKC